MEHATKVILENMAVYEKVGEHYEIDSCILASLMRREGYWDMDNAQEIVTKAHMWKAMLDVHDGNLKDMLMVYGDIIEPETGGKKFAIEVLEYALELAKIYHSEPTDDITN